MAAKVDTSAFRTPGGWLNLQGAKFKYLGDKVTNINSLKFVQEIDNKRIHKCDKHCTSQFYKKRYPAKFR